MVPFVVITAVCVLILTAATSWLIARMVTERIESQLRGIAKTIEISSFPLTSTVLKQVKGLSGADLVVCSIDGRVQASTRQGIKGLSPLSVPPSPNWQESRLGRRIQMDDENFYVMSLSLRGRAGMATDEVLHLLYPATEYHRAWRRALAIPLGLGTTVLLLAAGFSWAIAGRLSRQVQALQRQVRAIAVKHVDPLITVDSTMTEGGQHETAPSKDELRDLDRDIQTLATRLDDYEQRTRRTERMRTLSQIAAGIAHEMRNAVTGCRMAIDLHTEELGEASESEALHVARRQLELMSAYLQRFLQLGQGETERPNEPVDVVATLRDVLQLVGPAARHADVVLGSDIESSHVAVLTDPNSLGQVFLNLLLNAIEAAGCQPPHGAPRKVEVTLKTSESQVKIDVSDNGPGPPADVSRTLFDPFVTTKQDGVGLGLSVVREIVVRCGGTIDWVRDNERTTFCVVLPRKLVE